MPGADYHVKKVDFIQLVPVQGRNYDMAQPMMKTAMASEASGGGSGGAELLVSVKQSVSARIVLGRADMPTKPNE